MIETARRARERRSSDIVRRVMIRPIQAARRSDAMPVREAPARPDGSFERMQAEVAIMKAVLIAERAETEGLRARLRALSERRRGDDLQRVPA